MKLLLQLSLLLLCHICFSQNDTTVTSLTNPKTTVAKKPATGVSQFYKYITNHFITPSGSNFPGGKELVQFTIKADGTVGDIKILKDIGYGVGEQIKKILQNSPKWTPGMKDGIPVDCTYTIPIIISSNGDE